MGEEKPRRLSLMERSTRPDVPKFRGPSQANPPPAPPKKRVSFDEAQDTIYIYEVEREPSQSSLPGVWFSSFTAPNPVDEPETDSSSSDQLPVAPSTSSGGPKRKSRLFEKPTPASNKDKLNEDSSGSERVAEHGQDLDEEWSRISVAAQKKVHDARKRVSRASMRRPSAIGDQLVPSVFLSADSPPVASAAAVAAASVAKPKKVKKKKKKKKKRKKKQKKMSVMAFLRGSIKRGSKAKVERALKRMMKRIAKRVKRKHDKMIADQNVDMGKVRRAVRRGRKKKKLYTVKKVRGRKIGLKSLLKQWKWVFIFS